MYDILILVLDGLVCLLFFKKLDKLLGNRVEFLLFCISLMMLILLILCL